MADAASEIGWPPATTSDSIDVYPTASDRHYALIFLQVDRKHGIQLACDGAKNRRSLAPSKPENPSTTVRAVASHVHWLVPLQD